jgi:hypothetical protein
MGQAGVISLWERLGWICCFDALVWGCGNGEKGTREGKWEGKGITWEGDGCYVPLIPQPPIFARLLGRVLGGVLRGLLLLQGGGGGGRGRW